MSYTKGKWLYNAFGQIFAEIPGKQDQKIGTVSHCLTPRGEANAHLIAAAPDLLAACELFANAPKRLKGDMVEIILPRCVMKMYNKAIAKAKKG